MGLFDRKKKSNKKIVMATEILDKLGKTEKTYSSSLAMGGGYYTDKCYEGYGLKIIDSDYRRKPKGIYILFNNEVVYDKDTYIPGMWEDVLEELYYKVPTILEQERRAKKYYNKQINLLYKINQVARYDDVVNMSYNLRIEGYSYYTGYDKENYHGRNYTVYEDDKVVFRGFAGCFNDDKVYKYVPGHWEKRLDDYLDYSEKNKKEQKQKQTEQLARNNIKKLRKL